MTATQSHTTEFARLKKQMDIYAVAIAAGDTTALPVCIDWLQDQCCDLKTVVSLYAESTSPVFQQLLTLWCQLTEPTTLLAVETGHEYGYLAGVGFDSERESSWIHKVLYVRPNHWRVFSGKQELNQFTHLFYRYCVIPLVSIEQYIRIDEDNNARIYRGVEAIAFDFQERTHNEGFPPWEISERVASILDRVLWREALESVKYALTGHYPKPLAGSRYTVDWIRLLEESITQARLDVKQRVLQLFPEVFLAK